MDPYLFPCDYDYPLCSSCGLGASYHGVCGTTSFRVRHIYNPPHSSIKLQSKTKTRSQAKSKPRQHEGIVQRGPKKGSLKRGYKYTGERTANGLAVIVKTK